MIALVAAGNPTVLESFCPDAEGIALIALVAGIAIGFLLSEAIKFLLRQT